MRSAAAKPKLEHFEASLEKALTARFRQEASALGFRIRPEQARTLAGRLLESSAREVPGAAGEIGEEKAARPGEDFEARDYLHLVPQDVRRSLGQYMTPRPIAEYILRAAGYQGDKKPLAIRLCDPACGSGVFLVAAVQVLLRALRRTGLPIEDWYPKIQAGLVGIDVDPIACLYSRFNLSLLLAPAILAWMRAYPGSLPEPLPIRQQDTLELLAGEIGERSLLTARDSAQPLAGTIDLVVGNPPYKKLGRMSAELRRAFAGSIFGHPNAYGLFLHAGIRMLRPGGRLGFIVPRSMLSGLYFQNLRRTIEEETRLEEISIFSDRKRVFPQVLQGTMILVFRRRAAGGLDTAAEPTVRTAVIRSLGELAVGPQHVVAGASQVVRRLNGTTVWFISDRQRTFSLLDKIVGRHRLLGGPGVGCPAKTGPIVWNRVKPLLRPEGGPGTLPLIWATDVGRFQFFPGTAGDSRPAFLADTDATRHLANCGESLLVQRVTADEQPRRIVAGLAPYRARQRYFVENHLNILQPSTGIAVDLRFLLGILSSDVVEFLFRAMNGNTQVSATEINLLPVPRGESEAEIAELVSSLEEDSGGDRESLDQELNERVARAYGLSRTDLKFLQTTLREGRAPGGRSA